MSNKIKVIVKRPDEVVGHMTYIVNTLKNLQRTVDGYIETVPLADSPHRIIMICNDEGKLRGLSASFVCGTVSQDLIVGTVIICGAEEDEFTDVPISLETWKTMLRAWGNVV